LYYVPGISSGIYQGFLEKITDPNGDYLFYG
jgi:hypothetical protein